MAIGVAVLPPSPAGSERRAERASSNVGAVGGCPLNGERDAGTDAGYDFQQIRAGRLFERRLDAGRLAGAKQVPHAGIGDDLAPSSVCQPSSAPEKSQLRTSFIGPGSWQQMRGEFGDDEIAVGGAAGAAAGQPIVGQRFEADAGDSVERHRGHDAIRALALCRRRRKSSHPAAARIARGRLRPISSASSGCQRVFFFWLASHFGSFSSSFLSFSASAAWALAMRSCRSCSARGPTQLGDFAVGFDLGLQTGDAALALDFLLGELWAEFFCVGIQVGDELGVFLLQLLEHAGGCCDFIRLAGSVEESQEQTA